MYLCVRVCHSVLACVGHWLVWVLQVLKVGPSFEPHAHLVLIARRPAVILQGGEHHTDDGEIVPAQLGRFCIR